MFKFRTVKLRLTKQHPISYNNSLFIYKGVLKDLLGIRAGRRRRL